MTNMPQSLPSAPVARIRLPRQWLAAMKADRRSEWKRRTTRLGVIRLNEKETGSGLLLIGEHLLLDQHAVGLRRILLLRHVHAFLMA